jgi:hypothetical protein
MAALPVESVVWRAVAQGFSDNRQTPPNRQFPRRCMVALIAVKHCPGSMIGAATVETPGDGRKKNLYIPPNQTDFDT